MIKPDKYMDIDLSILALSKSILEFLQKTPRIPYIALVNKLAMEKGEDGKINIPYAIVFLYSIGLVEYNKKEDTVEFLNQHI